MTTQIAREQFNRQADKFANWSIGKNVEYLNGYYDFCGIKPTDRLLDVACGPGEFCRVAIWNIRYFLVISGEIIDLERCIFA